MKDNPSETFLLSSIFYTRKAILLEFIQLTLRDFGCKAMRKGGKCKNTEKIKIQLWNIIVLK